MPNFGILLEKRFSVNRDMSFIHEPSRRYGTLFFVRDCNLKFPTEVFYHGLQNEKKFVSDNTTKERNRLRICCLSDNYIISTECGQWTPLFT